MGLNHYLIKKWKEFFFIIYKNTLQIRGMEADYVMKLMLELAINKNALKQNLNWLMNFQKC